MTDGLLEKIVVQSHSKVDYHWVRYRYFVKKRVSDAVIPVVISRNRHKSDFRVAVTVE